MLNEILEKSPIQPLEPIPTGLQPAGRLAAGLQCLLFDVYGTLLISGSGDVGTAMQTIQDDAQFKQLLLEFNIEHPARMVLKNFFGTIARHHERLNASGIDYPEVKIDQIWMQVLGWHNRDMARSFAMAFELIANPVFPMPGLLELVKYVRERCCMGIISNAQFYTPLLLEKFFKAPLKNAGFARDLLIFSYQTAYAKPSEHLFYMAKQRLEKRGIAPSETLYLGNDMGNDILPAQKIGFKTALFAGDKRSLRLRQDDERCKGIVPDIVITKLIQLLDCL
jgi:putative hydrolase of the HAD superfamily